MLRRLVISLLLAAMIGAGCSKSGTLPKSEPTPVAAPFNGQTPGSATPSAKPLPPSEEAPLSITDVAIPVARAISKDAFIAPMGPVTLQVTAPGAEQVTLRRLRPGSGPAVDPELPTAHQGDRYSFSFSMPGIQRIILAVEATREGKPSVKAERWLYFLDPLNAQFTTVAQGTAKGWDSGKDAQVRDLFKEFRVLWLIEPTQIASFASDLNALVGADIALVDLEGLALLAILGAPIEGSRPFELIEMDRSFPGQLRLGMHVPCGACPIRSARSLLPHRQG